MVKSTTLLALLSLLGACATQPAQSDTWTRWVCDSQAEVLWRFADSSRESVDVRLGGGDIVYRLNPSVRFGRAVQRWFAVLSYQG